MNITPKKKKFLKQLSRLKLSEQKSILKDSAPDELINDLHFYIKQVVGNKEIIRKVNKKQIARIRKFRVFLRKIAHSKGKTPGIRKKIVHGLRGGILPALLPLIPVIASTVASIVSSL